MRTKLTDGIKMVTAIVSGYALGYYLGYEDNPNCTSKDFESQLQEQKFWVDLGDKLKAFYTLQFKATEDRTIFDAASPRRETLNLRDVYLPLRAAKIIDCCSASLAFSGDLVLRLSKRDEGDSSIVRATLNLVRNSRQFDDEYYGRRWWVKEKDGKWRPVPTKAWVIYGLKGRSTP